MNLLLLILEELQPVNTYVIPVKELCYQIHSGSGSGFAICKISRLEDRTLLKHRGNEQSLLEPQSCPRWPSSQQAVALFFGGSW